MASPVVGPPLTHSEVKAQVEAASPALWLEVDQGLPGSSGPGKGRILVARWCIGVGEVLLAEWPIFQGTPSASQSRKAFEAGFVALADNVEDFTDLDEDCLHPCSALCDCVAGIMLAKQQALAQGVRLDSGGCGGVEAEERRERSRLRLRQLGALCRSATESPPSDCAPSLLGVLRPDLRELTSEDELNDFLHVLSSNRFGSAGSQLDVMFAGSMFEHSCDPNCFVAGAWCAIATEGPREYRALRDIAVGEALSVDYMMLPGSYLGFSGRKETLTGWGFACSCPRCTERPELTRAFVCPACELHELCPTRPVPSGEAVELLCRACGKVAEADYSASCLSAETVVAQVFGGGAEEEVEKARQELFRLEKCLGRFHFANFDLAWASWLQGPDFEAENSAEELEDYTAATDRVIECIVRWSGSELHPQLLPVYHSRALLAHGDLDGQRCFLDLERAVLKKYFPEESNRQDAEILHMVQRVGPPGAASTAGEEASDLVGAAGAWTLSDMD
mmetsp:Transcript_24995/g.70234  ORF Transcript_24995/g.70234 Transcript_24995/m.70234 type:complete len:506 (+) Transcript_24995:46-1563(+)|eukprot:CAMPEP_0177481836 /NCGR_PEP_ID=MMETSP0369-20130122/26599_1 /TAXON_ID=447022 ORGANISM="Scrippsiella hangoei-like, Strain SHHI-4" /NCGR_SAMPLE_ID=MMETSP0369 /ASSEMBLY_ACC=CAM_ASM_000364 /LENGTH=505 /DNA_ID=CAMNT_0018957693 /DNA_START=22 /DNA_END=1539 /DNA_ORIENTATION=-